MARLDPTYAALKSQLADKSLSADQLSDVKVKLTEREQLLLPVYSQIALQFADLHDRAGRMEAKGVIRSPLKWQNARRFFYWRLRRRVTEDALLKRLVREVAPAASSFVVSAARKQNLSMLQQATGLDAAAFEKNDREVAAWYESNTAVLEELVKKAKTEAAKANAAKLLASLDEESRAEVLKALSS